MRYDFLLVASYKYDENILRTRLMVQALERSGYSAFVLTTSPLGDEEMQRHSIPFRSLSTLVREAGEDGLVDARTCRDVAAVYGVPNMVDFVALHCQMFGTALDNAIAETVRTFRAVECLFQLHEFRCLHQYTGGEIFRRVTGRVARRHGVPVLYFDFAPFAGKIRFSSDEEGTWVGLSDSTAPIPAAQLDEARQYVREAVARAASFFTAPPVRFVPRFGRILRMMLADWHRKFVANRGHEYEPLVRSYWGMLIRRVRRQYQRRFCRRPDPGEDYIFFPLHYPIETTLMIRARPFAYQEWLVEYLTRCLPQGYTLYVKEHPYSPGQFSTSFIRRLRGFPNIRLLHPEVSSHEVIRRAAAVVVINSTAGFEALLYGRPVVTVAPSYYANQGVTIDVRDLAQLPDALRRALAFVPDPDAITRLVARLRSASYDGAFWLDASPESVPETIDALLDCCARHLPEWADKRVGRRVVCGANA